MAKKTTTTNKAETPKATAAPKKTTTTVRNTAIPKATKAAATVVKSVEPTYDQIATRAFEIFASGNGGSEQDNWFRAEGELRTGV